eukprot:scaffold15586_cov100-Isochrysis_galbana.AAC.3
MQLPGAFFAGGGHPKCRGPGFAHSSFRAHLEQQVRELLIVDLQVGCLDIVRDVLVFVVQPLEDGLRARGAPVVCDSTGRLPCATALATGQGVAVTSTARGMMPLNSSEAKSPSIVCVFPVPVWPYANTCGRLPGYGQTTLASSMRNCRMVRHSRRYTRGAAHRRLESLHDL